MANVATTMTPSPFAPELAGLLEACRAGDAARAQALLDAGAPAGALGPEGQSSLMVAALNGHGPIVDLLLERGAAVATPDARGWSAAHFAAMHEGNAGILHALDRAGADLDARDADDCTPLLLAASGGCLANVRALREHRADMDALNTELDTPLSCACRLERWDTARFLVAAGADISRSERHLVSPLHWAISRGDDACVNLMLDRGAAIDEDPPGCVPLVVWIARVELRDATAARLLRGSRQTAPWGDVLRGLFQSSGRSTLTKLLDEALASR